MQPYLPAKIKDAGVEEGQVVVVGGGRVHDSGYSMLGALPAVGDVLLPHQLVEAVVVDGEGRHVADGVDVRIAGLQLAVHLRKTRSASQGTQRSSRHEMAHWRR